MSYTHTDDSPEYRFSGITPPRPGVVTFSAQRFHPQLAAPQDGDRLGQSGQAPTLVDSMVSSSVGVLMVSILCMTPFLHFPALLDNGAMSLWPSVWIRKRYENCATRARTMRNKVMEIFTVVWLCALSSFQLLCDLVVRATGLFRRRAMNVVDPLANSRLPITRVDV